MKKINNYKKIFFRFLLGATSEKENKTVYTELSNSKENLQKARKSFYSYSHVMGSSADKNWLDANYQKIERTIKQKTIMLRWMRVAAIFVGMLSVGLAVQLSGIFTAEPDWLLVSVPRGEQQTLTLPDGTKVHLAPATTFRYPEKFAKDRREVRIEGKGFFEVAKDTKRPFTVESPRTKIVVTGTSFNIRAYPQDMEEVTKLVEGAVSLTFTDANDKVLKQYKLQPMQKAQLNKQTGSVTVKSFDSTELPAWMEGTLSFRNQTFGDIAKRLERFYDVDIIFEDSIIKHQQMNGDFNDETVFEILDAIKILSPFSYEYNTNTQKITISAQTQ
ncbi:FecR family protein [Saccharicrinis carchari]|uniref:FecR family protein n=1 Tax=Saccharicrinis carchari TaxID=1168039 RepID=A0A521BYE9_SACCC|nr:FecR domain-containing protein [Saccharicrinis carchari]SMO52207.1 FecR family protein [Saccharicrinis carchari]